MNKISNIFYNLTRGTKGRRLARHLDDNAVARAMKNAEDPFFKFQYQSKSKRFAAELS